MEYRLDLVTLLHMLGQSTGTLQTDSLHISGVRGRCRAFLRLEQGQITDYSITDEYGKILFAQEVALKRLESQILEWHYTGASASLPTPRDDLQPLSPSPSPIPPALLRRVGQLSQRELTLVSCPGGGAAGCSGHFRAHHSGCRLTQRRDATFFPGRIPGGLFFSPAFS